jgi:hypothetical protein
MKTVEFLHKNWTFRVNQKESNDYEFEVVDPENTPIPDYLFKHYSLNRNAIDSLSKTYLYASHPRQLNDPYDCNKYIFDLESTSLYVFQNFLGFLESSDENLSIEKMYYSQRQKLIDLFVEGFWQIMYSKCGIISLSDLPTNIQMWAYYSKLNGFQIKLATQNLPANFKGPLKVRYSSEYDRISIKNDFFLPVLYQICNKEINWKHESEWRYLVIGPNEMEVPFSIFKNQQKSPHNRKFKFDISALKEITLGCYFFLPEEHIKIDKNHAIFDLTKSSSTSTELRLIVLNFITDHPEIETSLLFWEKFNGFKLIRVPIKVTKKVEKVFETWFDMK